MATRRRFRRQSRHLKKRRSHRYKKNKKSRRNYYNMRGGSPISIDISTFIEGMKLKHPSGFKLGDDNKHYLHVTGSILNFYMYMPDRFGIQVSKPNLSVSDPNPDDFSTTDWLNDAQKPITDHHHWPVGSVYIMTLDGNKLTSKIGNVKSNLVLDDSITDSQRKEILEMVGIFLI